MKCSEVQHLIEDWLSGEFPNPMLPDVVNEHVANCPTCSGVAKVSRLLMARSMAASPKLEELRDVNRKERLWKRISHDLENAGCSPSMTDPATMSNRRRVVSLEGDSTNGSVHVAPSIHEGQIQDEVEIRINDMKDHSVPTPDSPSREISVVHVRRGLVDDRSERERSFASRKWWLTLAPCIALIVGAALGAGVAYMVLAPMRDSSSVRPTDLEDSGKRLSDGVSELPVESYYVPSGVFGDLDDVAITNGTEGSTRFVYSPSDNGGRHESNWKYLEEEGGKLNPDPPSMGGCCYNNSAWGGDKHAGWDLRGLRPTKVVWEARSLSDKTIPVTFFIGGDNKVWEVVDNTGNRVLATYPESLSPQYRLGTFDIPKLPKGEWKEFTADVVFDENDDRLSRVLCAFGWVINPPPEAMGTERYDFEVRRIRYVK